MSDIESITITRDVTVKLTQAEIDSKRAQLAEKTKCLEEATERRKKIRAEKEEIEAVILKGEELRTLQCREDKHFRTGEVKVHRVDTDELVETRALSGEERQTMIETAAPAVETTGTQRRLSRRKKNGAAEAEPAADEGSAEA